MVVGIVDVAAGARSSLVVTGDGLVLGAGSNDHGQLTGTGDRDVLTPLSGLPGGVLAVAAAGGQVHTLVVGDDGVAYGSGSNGAGRLTGLGDRTTLTPLTGLPDGVAAVDVAAGWSHSLVLGDDGVVYGAGRNYAGDLTGSGDRSTLTPLTGLPVGVAATGLAAGSGHSLVLGDDGVVYGAGTNEWGQLTGSEDYDSLTALVGLPAGVAATAVAAGSAHTLVLGDNGVAYGAGFNEDGQLTGGVTLKGSLTPLAGLPAGVHATAVAAGPRFSLVLGDDGEAYGTGENGAGQLTGRFDRSRLAPVAGLPGTVGDAVAVAGGGAYSLVLGANHKAYGAGANGLGQLTGSGARTVLTPLGTLPPIVSVVAPRITGTARVGRTLTATRGTWDPAATSYRFSWRRDGVPITDATRRTYEVRRADRGDRLTVVVTAWYASGAPTARTSTGVRVP